MLVKIGGAVALVVALLIAVVATRPADFKVERELLVGAPGPVVYEQVADFHHWKAWSPWAKLDPSQKETFSGADKGVGAVTEWSGNDKVGQGRMTIVGAAHNQMVDIKLEFIKPFASTNQAGFTLSPQPGGTIVRWTMAGHLDFMGKGMSLFKTMDQMIGPDFEHGLANLKTVAEEEAKKAAAAPAPAPAAAPIAPAAPPTAPVALPAQ